MPEKTSSSWGVWHCVKLLLVLLGSRFLGIESVSTTLFGPFPKADNALARSEVFRSICSKKDRMQSCNVIRSPVNTSHSHRAVRLLSSWMASARDLHHARLHQILSHHWHSQIPAYLLTHLFLLHLATLQARTCRIVHSFFFFYAEVESNSDTDRHSKSKGLAHSQSSQSVNCTPLMNIKHGALLSNSLLRLQVGGRTTVSSKKVLSLLTFFQFSNFWRKA